jgi:hypothetical protein
MMAKLTKEMKTMFEQQLPVVATTSKNEIPNIGSKGSRLSHHINEFLYKINRFYYPPEVLENIRLRAFLKLL